MKLKQSILIGGSAILTIAGLLLVPYKNLNRIQAFLFAGGATAGFAGVVKGRQLEQDQEAFDLKAFELKQHQKMLEQSTLEVLKMEEVAIAKSRAQANVEIQSLDHQRHLQTLKQIKFPGLLEAQIEEARRRSELEQLEKMGRGDRQLQFSENDNSVSTNPELRAIQSANPNLEFYDFDDLVDDAAGIIIAGNTGAGKTSVACYVAGKLTEHNPAQVFALDPHYNDIWKEVGIHAIGEFNEIEEIINLLVKELDDRRARKRDGKPIGDTIICFTDELNACLLNCENQDSLETALKRLGSEGRKFGIILIAINQSSNVDDLGISGPYRANFLLILLGASARTISEKWKNTDDRVKWISEQVYPCCVAGCVGTKLAIHPTHNSYVKFKKKGNPPLNLLPINQLKHTFLPEKYRPRITKSVEFLESETPIADVDVNQNSDIEKQRTRLTRIYKESPNDAPPWDEWSSELTTEEIDRLIDERRSRRDNISETISDTPECLSEVPEDGIGDDIPLEPLQDIGYPRKWDADTFRKILPKEDENALFEKILKYLDTSLDTSGDRTKSYSKVIKFGLGFNKPRTHETRSYWNVGLPCFRYLLDQPGRETLKQHFSKAWDADNEEE
jgi:hypothetical protein